MIINPYNRSSFFGMDVILFKCLFLTIGFSKFWNGDWLWFDIFDNWKSYSMFRFDFLVFEDMYILNLIFPVLNIGIGVIKESL